MNSNQCFWNVVLTLRVLMVTDWHCIVYLSTSHRLRLNSASTITWKAAVRTRWSQSLVNCCRRGSRCMGVGGSASSRSAGSAGLSGLPRAPISSRHFTRTECSESLTCCKHTQNVTATTCYSTTQPCQLVKSVCTVGFRPT